MTYVLTAPPAVEPLTLAEVKAHLRVTSTSEDSLISSLIVAARTYCEIFCRRAFINQTWELYLDAFPDIIRIEKTPVSAITSIKYVAADAEDSSYTTLDTTKYQADIKTMHPRIEPAHGKTWPNTKSVLNAVQVTFVAGYGATAAAVPEPIKQAMRLLIGAWFGAREAIIVGPGQWAQTLPRPVSVDWILSAYRAWSA